MLCKDFSFSFQRKENLHPHKLKLRFKKAKSRVSTHGKTAEGLSWGALGRFSKDLSKSSKIKNISSTSHSLNMLWHRVGDSMHYPDELADIGVSGKVLAKIYIDKNGYFVENLSKINCGSPLLCIHVRRILRRALEKRVLKSEIEEGHYKAIFEFHRSLRRLKDYEVEMRSDGLSTKYFYAYQYGGETDFQKAYINTFETIGYIQNFFKALDLLPASKENKKIRIKKLIEDYKNDKYWAN